MTTPDRKQEAAKDLKGTLWARKSLGLKDVSETNGAIARNVLHEEFGMYGKYEEFEKYNLDDETRNRLLAHARQDAAHALLNTSSLLDETRNLRLLLMLQTIIFIGILLKLFF